MILDLIGDIVFDFDHLVKSKCSFGHTVKKNYLLQIIYLQKNKFNVKLYIILIKRRQGKKGGDRSKPFQKNH